MKIRPVGIESLRVYHSKEQHSSEYISKETCIPKDILEMKFGLKAKILQGLDGHTLYMGAQASKWG
ncbi:MAG: hypothetical protein ACFFAU_07935 [Candidatus Hodarchaeota archaeon]